MRDMWWVVGVVTVVVVVATYLTWTASRVDRLHARASAASATLDAHLVRRAVAASAVAEAAQLPALMLAARAALNAGPPDRESAENDLTRHLRDLVDPGDGDDADLVGPVMSPVLAASRRVALARQVHNDVVRDALAARRRLWVRAFGLARKHPAPAYFDVDDPAIELPAHVPAQQPAGRLRDEPQPADWPSAGQPRPRSIG
jgi:hypothetical protein